MTDKEVPDIDIDSDEETPPISPLVVALIEQQAKDLAYTTNALIDGLTDQYRDARAELTMIRVSLARLLHGPYQPSSYAIQQAMYPSGDAIDARRKQMEDNGDF